MKIMQDPLKMGPVFFNLFLNDLQLIINSEVQVAKETILFRVIKAKANGEMFQKDLSERVTKWQMQFNVNKNIYRASTTL